MKLYKHNFLSNLIHGLLQPVKPPHLPTVACIHSKSYYTNQDINFLVEIISLNPSLKLTEPQCLCSLTRFTNTGVSLPVVSAAAVGGARRRDTGVANGAARLHFDSSRWVRQGRGIRAHAQPDALQSEKSGLN